jgi:hypothetical protein
MALYASVVFGFVQMQMPLYHVKKRCSSFVTNIRKLEIQMKISQRSKIKRSGEIRRDQERSRDRDKRSNVGIKEK